MNLPQPLTKENCFNELMQKYPKSMKVFCEWIEEYKEEVGWEGLFNDGVSFLTKNLNTITTESPKYHELPQALQHGIWIEFLTQRNYFEIFNASDTLSEKMNNYFKYALEPYLNKL